MNKTSISILIAGSLVGLTTCTGLTLTSTKAYADNDSATDEVNITVPVSCTMSGIGMNTHNTEISNGTYRADIGTTALHASCNDNEGFAIYAAGYTGNEIGGINSNKLVGTNASGNATIETGLATSAGNPDVSNWAMKLSATSVPTPTYPIIISGSTADTEKETGDPDFSNYTMVPNDYTRVAYRTSGTDIGQNAEGATLATTYAAYISKTQPGDTYSGQVIYTLIHPASEAPNIDISIERAYAKNGKQRYNGYYKMQEMSDSICSIVTLYDEASQTQLIDTRDNKIYYVAKLQDGNCWMTQNLDHDIVTTPNYYTNENTDIGYNSSTQSYDTTSWTAEYATHASSDTYWCDEHQTIGTHVVCSDAAMASHDPGQLYWNGAVDHYESESECTAAGGIWVGDFYSCNQISSTGNPHYSLGNVYNWNAAVATNDSGSIAEGTLVDRSICPAGWTLPRPGSGANSFDNLLSNYGLTATWGSDIHDIWESPLYFGLTGSTTVEPEVGLIHVGYQGSYWAPYLVAHSYTTALVIMSDTLYPGDWDSVDGGNTAYGLHVRCLARPVTNTIEGL